MGSLLSACNKDQDESDGEVLGNFYSKGRDEDGKPVFGFAWNIQPYNLDAFVGDRVIKGRSKGPMTLAEFKELRKTRIVQEDHDCIGLLG
jgi:hypothetical protein